MVLPKEPVPHKWLNSRLLTEKKGNKVTQLSQDDKLVSIFMLFNFIDIQTVNVLRLINRKKIEELAETNQI